MLSQFMMLFGFFALVLVSIFWINKAVGMFDRLIGSGQSARVFVEFAALTLPGVIGAVLPIATFAAAVYVTNRLSTESELTVVQATGSSPYRLSRAAAVFGVIVALIMSLLSHLLIPASLSQLRQREAEVRESLSARFLEEGTFLHPAPGITFYIRDITPEGELRNVFLSDRRDPDNPVIYSSSRAYLVNGENGIQLVMVNGIAQSMRPDGNRLFVTRFEDFSYDISRLISRGASSLNRVEFVPTRDLMQRPDEVMRATGATAGLVQYTLHGRFTQALICVAAALIGFATLLLGSFSRFGVWWQILLAFLLLVGIKLIEGAVTGPVLRDPANWPLMYLPVSLGFALAALLLHMVARPDLWRRLLPQRRMAEAGP